MKIFSRYLGMFLLYLIATLIVMSCTRPTLTPPPGDESPFVGEIPFDGEISPGGDFPSEGLTVYSVSRTWYVATSGDNDNDCNAEALPCQSIEGVLTKVNSEESRWRDRYPEIRAIYHTIILAAGTYIEPSLSFYTQITLQGAGRNDTIIETNHPDNTVIEVINPLVTINAVTIRGGWVGISIVDRPDASMLTLNDATVTGNFLYGIWVQPSTSALITASQIVDNGHTYENGRTTWAIGILNEGHLEIHNSQINNNFYRGIDTSLEEAFAEITDSTISGNGYEYTEAHGAGANAITNLGTTLISGSTIHDNAGRGITNRGVLRVTNSTFSSNWIGIVSSASRIIYSEVSGTSLLLNYVTITQNRKNGLDLHDAAESTITNSIIANNGEKDCNFVFISPDATSFYFFRNINTDGTCPRTLTVAPSDLYLASLANNGGPTFTHALLPGSPAIDYDSTSEFIECIPVDQRGELRPAGAACDIGAYEYYYELEAIIPFTPHPVVPETAQVTATKNANCRYGPSTAYDIADTLFEGQTALVLKRTEDNNWYEIQGPSYGTNCWVSFVTVDPSGPIDGLPIGIGPALPDPPAASPKGCFVYDQNQSKICTDPCPVNAQPGGACTP